MKISRGVTAIIGGGGKTSLMLRLGRELCEKGSAAICTTTRIYPPDGVFTLLSADAASARAALDEHRLVCFGEREGEKLRCPDIGVEALSRAADYVIVEADGSMGLPLKAHAEHEPVIPDGADVIYVIGGDGIGQPIARAAHRPSLYAKLLGVDTGHIVTPKDAARMVDYAKKALFNKAESPRVMEYGLEFARCFGGLTVTASLREGKIFSITDNT